MKAIRVHHFGEPEVLKLEEIPAPVAGPGEILLEVRAVGVNPVETYQRSGSNPQLPLPWTPGSDAAGIVAVIGEGVTNVNIGDRVYITASRTGAYAEFCVANSAHTHPIPAGISFEQAAGLNIPYATAFRALFQRARAKAGETVFIHGGSGGVGIAAIQWARAAGLNVIGTAGSARGLQLVLDNGAHHAVDHSHPDYTAKVLELTGGRGADVILEMLANVNLGRDLQLLAPHGRVAIIGSRGKVEITPRDAMSREADIFGVMLFLTPPEDYRAIHAAISSGLQDGSLKPVIGRSLPLSNAPEAHWAIMTPGAHGKIVLVPG